MIERALQWLSRFGLSTEARSVIEPLLRSRALHEQARQQVLRTAVVWLNEQADSDRACDIIREVLDSSDLPEDLLVDAIEAARTWLTRPEVDYFRARHSSRRYFGGSRNTRTGSGRSPPHT